jgi:hypothetical protein
MVNQQALLAASSSSSTETFQAAGCHVHAEIAQRIGRLFQKKVAERKVDAACATTAAAAMQSVSAIEL